MMDNSPIGKSANTATILTLCLCVLIGVGLYIFGGAFLGTEHERVNDDGPQESQISSIDTNSQPEPVEYEPPHTPQIDEIPENGSGENFELVGHTPLLDQNQIAGNESDNIPRGGNGEITIADECVYVGSGHGNQPPLIVDIADPTNPTTLGPVPQWVPGVGNGIEGIEASGDVLAIEHRKPLNSVGVPVPEELPERGLSVWDISDCRSPELVARHDAGELDVHALRLWQDPVDTENILGVQTVFGSPDIQVIDLSGCPDPRDCEPEVIAEWEYETQFDQHSNSHEAMLSTDGTRMYVAQPDEGFLVLDSSNLIEQVRGEASCVKESPTDSIGEDHCLSTLDPEVDDRLATQTSIQDGWHHTLLNIPERPYMLALAESSGPASDNREDPNAYGSCPGSSVQIFGVATNDTAQSSDLYGQPEGAVLPDMIGEYSLPEQTTENCMADGWDPDAVSWPAWLSPHFALAFPDIAFVTYYSGGLRAIDISDPAEPEEVGHFFNEPVSEVRWAVYGLLGEPVTGEDSMLHAQSLTEPIQMFAFSYPLSHNGYIIYGDIHSGLYVLEYTGPHADQLPDDETCIPANPGAIEPGYEPCPPYDTTSG